MERHFLRVIALAVLALALTGCAGVGYTPGGGGDSDRINNALATDDVGFVRGAVQANTINPNQRIATSGYPDGAPIMAIAARAAALEVLR